MSALDILLCAVILLIVGLAVRSRVRARRQGRGCCGDCGGCTCGCGEQDKNRE